MRDDDVDADSQGDSAHELFHWDCERLNTLDNEVYTTIPSRILQLEWRLGVLDNKLGQLHGEDGFPDQQSIKRARYRLGSPSTPGSSPSRVGPGELEPSAPVMTETFKIGTPGHHEGVP